MFVSFNGHNKYSETPDMRVQQTPSKRHEKYLLNNLAYISGHMNNMYYKKKNRGVAKETLISVLGKFTRGKRCSHCFKTYIEIYLRAGINYLIFLLFGLILTIV